MFLIIFFLQILDFYHFKLWVKDILMITKDATINVQTSAHTVKASGNILSRFTWDIESNCEGPAKHNLRVSGNYNKPGATVFQKV